MWGDWLKAVQGVALRSGVQWFSERVDFSLEGAGLGDGLGVMDRGQVGTEAIMGTEAGQPCRVGSLGALSKSSPWNPQSFEGRWTRVMAIHPLAHVSSMSTRPFLHPGRTSEPRAWRGRNLLGTLVQGSWLPPISLYPSSHSRCQCLCQDLLALPPTPSLSVSKGRAEKESCHPSPGEGATKAIGWA